MTAMAIEPSAALLAVQERIGRGIEWLRDNDPGGAFHLWFEAGILPVTPLPAQDEARREAYKRYWKNRSVFESLFREMENREKMEGIRP